MYFIFLRDLTKFQASLIIAIFAGILYNENTI